MTTKQQEECQFESAKRSKKKKKKKDKDKRKERNDNHDRKRRERHDDDDDGVRDHDKSNSTRDGTSRKRWKQEMQQQQHGSLNQQQQQEQQHQKNVPIPVPAPVRLKTGRQQLRMPLPFEHAYIVAPMVGASEPAFCLLCRKYGAQAAYTPMMSAHQFATDPVYRQDYVIHHHQQQHHHHHDGALIASTAGGAGDGAHDSLDWRQLDRLLVCHVCANTVQDFCMAAQQAAALGLFDAVDLNLGCPQRTAYVEHYGSYLLGTEQDRPLICQMVHAAASLPQQQQQCDGDDDDDHHNNSITTALPICCKIRLLDTVQETLTFCRNLISAGVSLIAIHSRYRATWERTGPGARDGPAMLDQVAILQQALAAEAPNVAIIANGNVINFQNVQDNLQLTGAHGIMSAEGLLDDPALFLPRYDIDANEDSNVDSNDRLISVVTLPTATTITRLQSTAAAIYDPVDARESTLGAEESNATLNTASVDAETQKKIRKVLKNREKLNVSSIESRVRPPTMEMAH